MQQHQVHRTALGLLQQATVGRDEYGDARRPQRFDQHRAAPLRRGHEHAGGGARQQPDRIVVHRERVHVRTLAGTHAPGVTSR